MSEMTVHYQHHVDKDHVFNLSDKYFLQTSYV